MENQITLKRIPTGDPKCKVSIQFEFDVSDAEALARFGRVMRELIPEEERAQFMADFHEAGKMAGFQLA